MSLLVTIVQGCWWMAKFSSKCWWNVKVSGNVFFCDHKMCANNFLYSVQSCSAGTTCKYVFLGEVERLSICLSTEYLRAHYRMKSSTQNCSHRLKCLYCHRLMYISMYQHESGQISLAKSAAKWLDKDGRAQVEAPGLSGPPSEPLGSSYLISDQMPVFIQTQNHQHYQQEFDFINTMIWNLFISKGC